jgi:hypothetical protein
MPIVLHVGIDFGTRYTKVCFRDLGRNRSGVVAFTTSGQGSLDDAVIRSHISIEADTVVTGLTEAEWRSRPTGPHATGIDYIKMRLAQLDMSPGDGWRPAPCEECRDQTDVEALATFFLARVIDRSRQAIVAARPDLFAGRTAQWSFSIGVPVRYRDSPARSRFERVLVAATAWADRGVPERSTVSEVRSIFASLPRTAEDTCWVVSEIGAAIQSFITSPRAPEGVYLYFDVGAGTLDGASFRFFRPPEQRSLIDFYSGEVEPLGVSAVAAQIASVVARAPAEIEQALVEPDPGPKVGHDLGDWRRGINRLVASVILGGKWIDRAGWSAGLEQLARAYHWQRRGRRPDGRVPLFIGGGGSLLRFYQSTVLSTYNVNGLEAANVRPYVLEDLPFPDDLDMGGLPAQHYRRFAVAYGLSIPPDEAPDQFLPSERLPEPPRERPSAGPRAPAYENTKEMT